MKRLSPHPAIARALARLVLVATTALSSTAALSSEPALAPKASWAGVVTYVVDGDTVYVRPLEGGEARNIRLLGMDAPEICQPGGVAARQALQERLLQRHVRVQSQRKDDYGRDLAKVYLGREDVGQWMVRHGQAWSYRFRQELGVYATEEQNAKVLGRGLFADPASEYPGDFRRRHGPCRSAP
jgi:endonuclease YncB( thermonuclease family)